MGWHARRPHRRRAPTSRPALPCHPQLARVHAASCRGYQLPAGALPAGLRCHASPARGGGNDRLAGVPRRHVGVPPQACVHARPVTCARHGVVPSAGGRSDGVPYHARSIRVLYQRNAQGLGHHADHAPHPLRDAAHQRARG